MRLFRAMSLVSLVHALSFADMTLQGLMTDTDVVASLLHSHGALSCWDCAASAPYLPYACSLFAHTVDAHCVLCVLSRIAMNGSSNNSSQDSKCSSLSYKDAVAFSPHKFAGGPSTPGQHLCSALSVLCLLSAHPLTCHGNRCSDHQEATLDCCCSICDWSDNVHLHALCSAC